MRVEGGAGPELGPSVLTLPVSLCSPALTHTPDVLIPGTLESGRSSNLTCSVPWACERGTPPIFSWGYGPVTSLGPRNRSSSVLTLTPGPQDQGSKLICRVTFPGAGVTVERTVQLELPCECGPSWASGCVPGRTVAGDLGAVPGHLPHC